MNEYKELFAEFDTNTLCVSDFNIVVSGVRVDYVRLNDDNQIEVWAGKPDTDKYAEELVLDKATFESVMDEISDNF